MIAAVVDNQKLFNSNVTSPSCISDSVKMTENIKIS